MSDMIFLHEPLPHGPDDWPRRAGLWGGLRRDRKQPAHSSVPDAARLGDAVRNMLWSAAVGQTDT